MKMLIRLSVIAVLFSACGTTLTEQGRAVRVLKEEPEGCREIGDVSGSGGGGGYTTASAKLESARNELRNETARMGGNVVVMDMSGSDQSAVAVSGRAFLCGGAPARTPAAVTIEPAGQPRTTEERIRELQDLRDKGFITPDEFEKRRTAILDAI